MCIFCLLYAQLSNVMVCILYNNILILQLYVIIVKLTFSNNNLKLHHWHWTYVQITGSIHHGYDHYSWVTALCFMFTLV